MKPMTTATTDIANTAYQPESPTLWHSKRLLRIGYYPKWRNHQDTAYKNLDPEALVRQAKAMGVSVFEWAIPENQHFIEWEGVPAHRFIDDYQGDILADLCEAGRKYDVKIVLCWPTNGGHECMHNWRMEDAATLATTGYGLEESQAMASHLCPNYTRYRQWVQGYITELATRYDIDGFIFDGPWMRSQHVWPRHDDGSVACQLCCDAHRESTGHEVPLKKDWSDPAFRAYVKYYKGMYNGYLRWLTGVVKKVDPNLFVTYNTPVYIWGSWGDTCDWGNAQDTTDSFFFEMHMCSGEELQPVLQMKLNRAALNGRAPETYCCSFDLHVANFAYAKPSMVDVAGLGYLSLSEGAIVGIHSSMDDYAQPHSERTEVYTQFGRDVMPKMPYFTDATPVEHVGVLVSERTRDHYSGENPSQYLVSPVGMMQMLSESQRTFGVMLDRTMTSIEALRKHPVLILANAATLTTAEADTIRQYVTEGGALLATGETSLFDECDRLRDDFLLSDVLGVHYTGPSTRLKEIESTPNFKRYPFIIHGHDIGRDIQDRMITWSPWHDIKAADDRDVVASWAQLRPDTDFCCVNGGVEIIGDSNSPAIVAGSYGKGRVIYASPDFSGRYMNETNRHIRQLLLAMVDWLSPAPIKVDTYKHVHFSVTRQTHESRLIVHLVNIISSGKGANEVLGHGFPYVPNAKLRRLGIAPTARGERPEVDPSLSRTIDHYRTRHRRYEADSTVLATAVNAFEEVIPLYDVPVQVDTSVYPFESVIDIETNKPLTIHRSKNDKYTTIVVPRLDLYKGLALSFKAGDMPE